MIEAIKNKYAVFIILMSFILALKVTVVNHNWAFKFKGLDNKINFCESADSPYVQKDYYSDLAKGFLNGQLSMYTKPHPKLLDLDNPYATPAGGPGCTGLIIQDASLFDDKYYLYYGPAPVLLIYIPSKLFFGFIPTDAFIITLLSMAYILLLTLSTLYISTKNKVFSTVFYFGFLFNPIWIYAMNLIFTAGVARMFCVLCILLSYALILYLRKSKNEFYTINLIGLLLTLAAITRPTFVPEYLILGAYVLFTEYKKNIKALLTATSISIVLWLSTLSYNFYRFGDYFENGQKYILNGGDYINNGNILTIPSDFFSIVSNYIYRIYEYFFAFPSFAADGSSRLNFSTSSDILPGAYSEGVIGYFIYNPLLLFLMIFLFIHIKKFNKDDMLIYVSMFLFLANFFLISLLQLTALHFVLEFIPRLMIILFLVSLSIPNVNYSSFWNKKFIILLVIVSSLVSFQTGVTWEHF